MRVDEHGRVVEVADDRLYGQLWTEGDRSGIYAVKLPDVFTWRKPPDFVVSVGITKRIDDIDVAVPFRLAVHVAEDAAEQDDELDSGVFRYGFVAQELYDEAVRLGIAGTGRLKVEDLLSTAFKDALERTPAVEEAILEYSPGLTEVLVAGVRKALDEVRFTARFLSNLTDTHVAVGDPTFSASKVFNGAEN